MDNGKANLEISESAGNDNSNGDAMGSLSSDDHEEFDDEIEPRLKYERMSNNLTSILSRDEASCLAVHSKFLAVGTQWGSIFIMDHVGNVIDTTDIICHSTTVNQISIDNSGEYLASCSDDGKVIINGLYTTEDNQVMNFDRPIKSVAIDPNYGKSGSNKQFVTGDSKVVLHERGFLGRQKSSCIHENSNQVHGIKWQSTFIAWSSNNGVHIYDMSLKRRISLIVHMKPEKSCSDKEGDETRCTLFWKNERTLIIARLNTIQVCVIKDSVKVGKDGKGATARVVEIIAREELDFTIAGLCFYNDSYVVLSYSDASQKDTTPSRPHLRIINASNGDEITNDALSIRGFQSYECKNYHLECCLEEGMFFVVSPKDIVVARQRDEDDHLDWLIEHEEFQEAMEFATNNFKLLKKRTCQDVGFQWFTTLFDEKRYKEAADLCPQLFGRNKDFWESYIIRFKQFNQLTALAHVIPVDNPRLDTSTYEMVLYDFLNNKNGEFFMDLIKKWGPELYNRERLIGALMDQLERNRNNIHLLESLGHLYTESGQFEKAFYIYVKLGHKDIFELIYRHNLFDDVVNHVVTLMDFNLQSTVNLLVTNVDKIQPFKVISKLKKYPEYLLNYLSHLIKRDQQVSSEYHQMLVELYADHDPPKLLTFLQTSSFISLPLTLELCRKRYFVKETIYLLDRMGNSREALRVMLRHDVDVDTTINFCKNHSDPDLWQDLIQHSVDKPEFVIGLLNNIGGHVDPILLIRQIKERMEIPGLRDALIKIINDYNQQVHFHERCAKLSNADFLETFNHFISIKKAALVVDESTSCEQKQCQSGVCPLLQRRKSELVVFHCQHVFHLACLCQNFGGDPSCPICFNEISKTAS